MSRLPLILLRAFAWLWLIAGAGAAVIFIMAGTTETRVVTGITTPTTSGLSLLFALGAFAVGLFNWALFTSIYLGIEAIMDIRDAQFAEVDEFADQYDDAAVREVVRRVSRRG